MSHLKTYCEVTWEKDGELKDGEPVMERDYYYLLHFGLRYDIIENQVVNYTVAICQNVKTGQLEYFNIEQIRIIGQQIKE